MEENVKLTALLDKKEAELLAMHEQYKVAALSVSNMISYLVLSPVALWCAWLAYFQQNR